MEIYEHYLAETKRLSPDTPFAICTDNTGVWDLLGDKIPMARDNMFCCRGAVNPPGGWAAVKAAR